MDEREQQRKIKHRLNVLRHAEEVTGNVALTCRYFGISRPTFYKWRDRYERDGPDGLRDRSSAPHHSPNVTRADVVAKIIHLRSHYHFGPHKIAMYLARYHDVAISPSGVYRILKRLDMNRLPASQRHKPHNKRWYRYEKQQPGHRLQVDVKFVTPLAGSRRKHYQFTAIDDCTRLRVLKIYDRCNQATAIRFIDYVLAKLPFEVHSIQTDNGAEFQSRFHWHVVDQGIQHTYIRPKTPGSTARSRDRTASIRRSSTASSRARSSTTPTCSTSSCSSGRTTTTSTAHTAALGGQTPYERLRQKTPAPS